MSTTPYVIPKTVGIILPPPYPVQVGGASLSIKGVTSSLLFPVERIFTDKDVTIDGVLIYAESKTGGQIGILVNGNAFVCPPDVSGNAILAAGDAKNFKFYPQNGVAITVKSPQLLINFTGSVAIGEASMYGTVSQGRPF